MSASPAPAGDSPSQPHALSFGQAADLYDAARPDYPSDALQWAFGDSPRDIVDLGAGTGLLSRGLLARGHRVTVVEPDEQMLARLTATTAGLAAHHVGAAEDIPLPDACADFVTAGQAYHWFDPAAALPEIARVLRPGGAFCPIWNVRDESVGWVEALSGVVGSSDAETLAVRLNESFAQGRECFGPLLSKVELRVFRHEKPLDAEGLLRLVRSRSYYLTADADRRSAIVAGVRELLTGHPSLAGRERFTMPYATYVFRAKTA